MAEKFTHQVCQQLDQSLDQLDPALVDKLALARRAALAQKPVTAQVPKRPLMAPLFYLPAMAAALIAMIILPNVSTHGPDDAPQLVTVTSIYELEPDLLDTMDLLWAVDDLAEREMNAL